MWSKLLVLLCVGVSFLGATPSAESLASVPEPLRAWVPWVLRNHPELQCPLVGTAAERQCQWLHHLALDVTPQGATFTLQARLFAPGHIALPGDSLSWPEPLQSPAGAVIIPTHKAPSTFLPAGSHTLRGRIPWATPPRSLAIPPTIATLQLRLNGKTVPHPLLDVQGSLWLSDTTTASATPGDGASHLRVYRLLTDDIPARLETRVVLELSGKDRELILDSLPLPGTLPLQLKSPLPARLSPEGRLQIQGTAGQWTLILESRFTTPPEQLTLPSHGALLPGEEFWSVQTRLDLRKVDISGGTPIDAERVQSPEEWRHLPTFRLEPGQTLVLKEIHRGAPRTDSAALQLERDLYPDFSGLGATVIDRIEGAYHFPQRLALGLPLELGRVDLDQQPTQVTQIEPQQPGLEVPAGKHHVKAVARLEQPPTQFSGTGWNTAFEKAQWTLHIPVGWTLLHASGAEQVLNTWVSGWTLWSVFLTVLTLAAASRLLGRWAGLLTAFLLVVGHSLQGLPSYLLLNLFAAILLWRLLPHGKLITRWVGGYTLVSALLLGLFTLTFTIDQFRIALHPQLENPSFSSESYSYSNAKYSLDEVVYEEVESKAARRSLLKASPNENTQQDGAVQTGPGQPEWSGSQATLRWSSTLMPQQSVRLYWLSPLWGRLLRVAVVLALWALSLWLLRRFAPLPRFNGKSLWPILAISCWGAFPAPAQAQSAFPSSELLNELTQHLSQVPACTPHCANINQATLQANAQQVELQLLVESQSSSALLLPTGNWTLHHATCTHCVVGRNPSGQLMAALSPGRHTIRLQITPQHNALDIAFPTPAHRNHTRLNGWTLDSTQNEGPLTSWRLRRQQVLSNAKTPLSDSIITGLSPFVQVERQLFFDRQWNITTRVTRLAPTSGSVTLDIPLLPGESILSGHPVQDNHIRIHLSDEQPTQTWNSWLPITSTLTLNAPQTTLWTEQWSLRSTSRWQIQTQGLPGLGEHPQTGWLYWRPWPGESLTLHAKAPQAVPGPTYTIESAHLQLTPGLQSHRYELQLKVVSSLGGTLPLQLPPHAKPEKLIADNQAHPVSSTPGQTLQLPLRPGEQTITLHWKQPGTHIGFIRTPPIELPSTAGDLSITLHVPYSMWLLALGGPLQGPALLYWGILAALLLVSFFLRKLPTPLTGLSWALILAGTSTAYAFGALPFVAWMALLAWRSRRDPSQSSPRLWNATQVFLALLGVVSLGILLGMIPYGLLGQPDMAISGNGSSSHYLHWYLDRASTHYPTAWIFAWPLWVYRAVMLIWSLWMVRALGLCAQWAWKSYSAGTLWIKTPKVPPPLPKKP